jgi:hypothetical protein
MANNTEQIRSDLAKNKAEYKDYVWKKAKKVQGFDPAHYREDKSGNIIYWFSYGKNS